MEDVPTHLFPQGERQEVPPLLTSYKKGTNGTVYEQVIIELPALDEEQALCFHFIIIVFDRGGLGDNLPEVRRLAVLSQWGHPPGAAVKGAIDDEQAG